MENKKEKVELQPLKKKIIKVKIKGITSLLMEKMNMDVVERYNKKKGRKTLEDNSKMEEDMIEGKIHYTPEGNIGFPSSGFMQGITEVAPYLDGLDKKKVRGSVRILQPIIPICFKKKVVRVDWGKTSGMTRSPRKIMRPEFKDWSCEVEVMYNASNISAEQIINLFNWAGFQMGLGGWRPEHDGTFGQYAVVTR